MRLKAASSSRLFAGVLLVLLISACKSTTEPLPNGARPFAPPQTYQTWWQEVESCSGIAGNFGDVSWYYVPDVNVFTVGANPNVAGYWQPYHHSVTLAGSKIDDPDLVRHEMLHALLKLAGHPVEYFDQRCGSIVTSPNVDS
jgi:hypothetical protein